MVETIVFRFASGGRRAPSRWEYIAWGAIIAIGPAIVAWMYVVLDADLTSDGLWAAGSWVALWAIGAPFDLVFLRRPRELLVRSDGSIAMRYGSKERRVSVRDLRTVSVVRPARLSGFGTEVRLEHSNPGSSRSFMFDDTMSEAQERDLMRALDPFLRPR